MDDLIIIIIIYYYSGCYCIVAIAVIVNQQKMWLKLE